MKKIDHAMLSFGLMGQLSAPRTRRNETSLLAKLLKALTRKPAV